MVELAQEAVARSQRSGTMRESRGVPSRMKFPRLQAILGGSRIRHALLDVLLHGRLLQDDDDDRVLELFAHPSSPGDLFEPTSTMVIDENGKLTLGDDGADLTATWTGSPDETKMSGDDSLAPTTAAGVPSKRPIAFVLGAQSSTHETRAKKAERSRSS